MNIVHIFFILTWVLPSAHSFISSPTTLSIGCRRNRLSIDAENVVETSEITQVSSEPPITPPPPQKLQEMVELMRLRKNVLPVTILCVLSGYVTNPYSWHTWIHSPPFLAAFTMVQMITASSMIINDIYDVDIDRINNPTRPLVTGTISIREASQLVRILLSISCYLGLQFLPPVVDPIWITSILMIAIYTPVLKKITLVKNISCAMVVASTVPFIGMATLNPLEQTTATSMANLPLMLLTSQNIFFSSLYIESLLDILDMKGDNASGIHTIPVIFGKHITLLMIGCVLLGFNIYMLFDPNTYTIISTLTIYLPYYIQLYRIGFANNEKDTRLYIHQAIKGTTIAMGWYFLISTSVLGGL